MPKTRARTDGAVPPVSDKIVSISLVRNAAATPRLVGWQAGAARAAQHNKLMSTFPPIAEYGLLSNCEQS
jgi:hypothetical protein